MSSLLIRNVRALDPGKGILTGDVLVQDGRIVAIGTVDQEKARGAKVEEGGGRLLTPGLIDVHTHGITQFLFEGGPEGLRNAAQALGQFGVTTVTPTLVPPNFALGSKKVWLENLAATAAVIPTIETVHIPGLHLEGPFLAITGAGCATMDGDLGLLEEILEAGGGKISVMSISPETPNILPVIRRLREKGIKVFLTHTRASVAQSVAALDAGATHATHFYDVFYPPAETDPGVRPVGAVESVLAHPKATVDFIADGIHVDPMAIRAAVAAKTWAGVVLITDSNIGAGSPPGIYETPWGFSVRVSPKEAARRIGDNALAGSALTMDRGMANLLNWLSLPPELVWAMGTLNPARVLGLPSKGRLQPGADADLVLWEEDITPAKTWLRGRYTYERPTGT